MGKSDGGERESREKRDYEGERERERERHRVCLFGGEIGWMENFFIHLTVVRRIINLTTVQFNIS